MRSPDRGHGGAVTTSTNPAQADLFVSWIFGSAELPFDVEQAVVLGPDGTRYPADIERSHVEPEVVEFVFTLDFIPEILGEVGFGIVPR